MAQRNTRRRAYRQTGKRSGIPVLWGKLGGTKWPQDHFSLDAASVVTGTGINALRALYGLLRAGDYWAASGDLLGTAKNKHPTKEPHEKKPERPLVGLTGYHAADAFFTRCTVLTAHPTVLAVARIDIPESRQHWTRSWSALSTARPW